MFAAIKKGITRAANYLSSSDDEQCEYDYAWTESAKRRKLSFEYETERREVAPVVIDEDNTLCGRKFLPSSQRKGDWKPICTLRVEGEHCDGVEIKKVLEERLCSYLNVEQTPYTLKTGAWVYAYRCPQWNNGCAYKARAITKAGDLSIETKGNHLHDSCERPRRGLTQEQKSFVDSWVAFEVPTPSAVVYGMVNKASNILPLPRQRAIYDQVRNYLKRLKDDQKDRYAIKSLHDFTSLCEKSPLDFSNWEKASLAGVLAYDVNFEMKTFRVAVSTPNMIHGAYQSSHVVADATYKLNYLGWPVLVIGTLSVQKPKFRLLGLALSNTEKEDDFKWLFKCVKDKCEAQSNGKPLQFEQFTSDSAFAIRNAAKVFSVEPNMCYFHVTKNVKENKHRLLGTKEEKNRKLSQILDDIEFLRLIPYSYEAAFVTIVSLFLTKWEKEKDFVSYFKREWVTKTPRWGGAYLRPGTANTNNALERFNRELKVLCNHKRPNLGEHLDRLLRVTNAWGSSHPGTPGKDYDKFELGPKQWNDVATYIGKCDRHGIKYQGLQNDSSRLIISKAGIKCCHESAKMLLQSTTREGMPIPKPEENDLLSQERELASKAMDLWRELQKSEAEIRNFFEMPWTCSENFRVPSKNSLSFHDVRHLMECFYLLEPIPEEDRWCTHVALSCTCGTFQLKGWCKHALSEGLEQKLIMCPTEYQQNHWNKKKSRGRPKNTATALQRQPGEVALTFPNLEPA